MLRMLWTQLSLVNNAPLLLRDMTLGWPNITTEAEYISRGEQLQLYISIVTVWQHDCIRTTTQDHSRSCPLMSRTTT